MSSNTRNIKIIKITFYGLKKFIKSACVNFKTNAASIIFGENGSGKTYFLNAIHYFLEKNDQGLVDLEINKITCIVLDNQDETEVVVQRTELDAYDWSAFRDSPLNHTQSIMFGTSRGIKTEYQSIQPRVIFDLLLANPKFKENNEEQDLLELTQQLSYEITKKIQCNKAIKADTKVQINKNHALLETIEQADIESMLMQSYKAAHEDYDITQRQIQQKIHQLMQEKTKLINQATTDDFLNEFTKIQQATEQNEHNLQQKIEPLKQIINAMEQHFIDDKKLIVTDKSVRIETKIGGSHSIEELSSGERNLLTIFTVALLHGTKRNFIIIDEPEISLSLPWKRSLITTLAKIAPQVQFIMTTHSSSIPEHPDDLCELIRETA